MTQIALTKDWYKPNEIAALLHVSRATVYRLIESGTLIPLLKRGSPYTISRAQIEKLLAPDDWITAHR